MTNEEKAQEIYNIIYKQCVEDGYHEKIATACAIMGKTGAEIMVEWKDNMLEKFLRKYAIKLDPSNPAVAFSDIYNSWTTFQDNYPNNKQK